MTHSKLVVGIPTPLKNMKVSWGYYFPNIYGKIKGPDNPTSQPLPIMSIKGCSKDGEGRKGEGGGEEVKTVVCDKVVECERWCVTKKDGVCVTKQCVKDGVCESCV